MYRGLLISSGFHVAIVMVSILALPFVAKKPLDIPPLISVELIPVSYTHLTLPTMMSV